jgi:hypothetical protein
MFLTAALRIYLGFWRAVTVKLKAEHIEPVGLGQWANVCL